MRTTKTITNRLTGHRFLKSFCAYSKTTEIYTHISTKGFEKVKSPMDSLDT
jgi:hypothetical protein